MAEQAHNLPQSQRQWQDFVAAVNRIAQQAGQVIMQVYAQDFAVDHKDDASPVTQADLRAHHIISQALHELTPVIPVLTEEQAAPDFAERRQWQSYWLVDPLDGTREFIKRNGEFTVNIALVVNHQPVLGVVLAPALDELYFATVHTGAYVQREGRPPQAISVSREATPLRLALSRSHISDRELDLIDLFSQPQIIRCGSALKSCLIAEGRADIYPRLGPTSEWDTAASQCVLEQAGGFMIDLDGSPLSYNHKESLINPRFIAARPGFDLKLDQITRIANYHG
ncbi:MAG TPA: 3'(2'),5'-bisphosphate nucleotidase [Halothiobacillaceae bacterium]|nr:3'(2'),5'-bisphosphate nucleotidase [Halothiobacillaceae bacterium]